MSATLYRTTVRGSYPGNTPKIRNYRTTPQRPCWLAAGEILEISNFPEILENSNFPVIFQNLTSVHTHPSWLAVGEILEISNFPEILENSNFPVIFQNFISVHTQAGSPQAKFWNF